MQPFTINDIQSTMRANGSHWFDADSMASFGCRLDDRVYNGASAFFVSSEKRFDDSRGYSVRRFDGESIETIGEFCGYETLAEAREAARDYAGDIYTIKIEKHKPVSYADDLLATINAHGGAATMPQVVKLIRLAKSLDRQSVALCNGDIQKIGPSTPNAIRKLAKTIGVETILGGDPRGCVAKLVMPDGYTNDFAREGVCVPYRS